MQSCEHPVNPGKSKMWGCHRACFVGKIRSAVHHLCMLLCFGFFPEITLGDVPKNSRIMVNLKTNIFDRALWPLKWSILDDDENNYNDSNSSASSSLLNSGLQSGTTNQTASTIISLSTQASVDTDTSELSNLTLKKKKKRRRNWQAWMLDVFWTLGTVYYR